MQQTVVGRSVTPAYAGANRLVEPGGRIPRVATVRSNDSFSDDGKRDESSVQSVSKNEFRLGVAELPVANTTAQNRQGIDSARALAES